MRFVLFAILLLHAGIHLLGTAKAWHWHPLSSLPIQPGRVQGFFWLLCAITCTAAAIGYLFEIKHWWWLGIGCAVLSQILVALAWKEAWAGTLPNLILALLAMNAGAAYRFEETTKLLEETIVQEASYEKAQPINGMENLPPIVQK